MDNECLSAMKFLVLADSHGKFIPKTLRKPSFNVVTTFIRGLKWIDTKDQAFSLYALLSSSNIKSLLNNANGVLFLVGTNSVRIVPAQDIIDQVEQVVVFVQQNFPELHQPGRITITLAFPCFKTSGLFRYPSDLMFNINLYNKKLKSLADRMNFDILDLPIFNNHLASDRMHVDVRFNDLIYNPIFHHFEKLSQALSTALAVSNKPKASQSSGRSPEAIQRRNRQRHQKLKLKQKENLIKRKIFHAWSLLDMKEYLKSFPIKYARIQSMHNNILRLQFYNHNDRDLADSQLGADLFDEHHYQKFINNQS